MRQLRDGAAVPLSLADVVVVGGDLNLAKLGAAAWARELVARGLADGSAGIEFVVEARAGRIAGATIVATDAPASGAAHVAMKRRVRQLAAKAACPVVTVPPSFTPGGNGFADLVALPTVPASDGTVQATIDRNSYKWAGGDHVVELVGVSVPFSFTLSVG